MKKKIGIIFLVFVFLLTNMSLTFAKTKSELRREINAKQNEINKKKEEKAEITSEIKDITKQIESLNSKIGTYETEIKELDSKLDELEITIAETQEKLVEAEKNYQKQGECFQSRIVAQYENGETTYLDVILGGGTIWDMISNWLLVSDIAEMDNVLLEQIEENERQIKSAKEVLETSKAKVETLKNNKETTKKSLEDSQVAKEKFKTELTDEEKQISDEIDKLKEENRILNNALWMSQDKYSDEIANLGGTGVFQRPVKSGVITATMYYPRSGRYHGALDIGVSSGTTVYAAAEGVVLKTCWSGGYGYLTCLQHADGIRTYYGHGNGTYYVHEGQVVQKGQAIMLSGNTGNSSGPHLHFEVRVAPYHWFGPGDSRQDPRAYLNTWYEVGYRI